MHSGSNVFFLLIMYKSILNFAGTGSTLSDVTLKIYNYRGKLIFSDYLRTMYKHFT